MDVTVVKAQIRNKQFDHFYIFTGDEVEVQRIYVDEIVKRSNSKVRHADTVAEIVSKLGGGSMFRVPTCYIIRDDADFIKNEAAWGKIETLVDDDMLILQLSSVDRRGKFYKHYKDKIVEFERLPVDVLVRYIQREIPLSKRNSERLVAICERDYSRILLEIDKIKRVASDVDEAFERLLKDGTIYQPPKDAIFEWVDAVMNYKVNEAFELYDSCVRKEVSVLAMLSVLYTAVKQQLQVQDAMRNGSDVAKATGLSSFQIKVAKERRGVYSIGDLVYMLKKIRETEVGVKTGLIDEKYAVAELMVKIL